MSNAIEAAFDFVVDITADLIVALGVDEVVAEEAAELVVEAVATAAVNAAFAAVLAPDVAGNFNATEWKREADPVARYVIGRRGVSGNISHRRAYGAQNRYQSIVTVLSGAAPVNAISEFHADDTVITLGANGVATNGGSFKDKLWMQSSLGAQPQATALMQGGLPKAGGGFEGWTASHKLSGKAHVLTTYVQDSKGSSYPAGLPRHIWTVEGINAYDPRQDSTYPGGAGLQRADDPNTWSYSENPYVWGCTWALGLFENGVRVAGLGAAPSSIDFDAYVEGANVADANGWTVSGVITSDDDKKQVMDALLQAGCGRYVRDGGKISCVVNAPRVSSATVSARDTAGPVSVTIGTDHLRQINTITPSCIMEAEKWEMIPQDPVSEAAYIAADGGERAKEARFPYVAVRSNNSNKDQPAELAAYTMLDMRESIRGTIPLKPYMRQIKPGSVFTIDEPGFLLDGQECLCLKREFNPTSNIVKVTFVSETASKHAYALGQTNTPPTSAALTAPDIFDVPAPGVGVWAAAVTTGDQPGVIVSGATDNLTATHFRVDYRPEIPAGGGSWADDDSGWQTVGTYVIGTETVPVSGLEPQTSYDIAVSYISEFGIVGERRIIATITTGIMNAGEVGGASIANIDQSVADVQAGVDETQEELDGARDQIATGAADLGAAVDALRDSFAPGFQTAEEASASRLAGLDSTDEEALVRINRLEPPAENLIQDAWFKVGGGEFWRIDGRTPADLIPTADAMRVGAEVEASGSGLAVTLSYSVRKPVKAGEVFEISAGVFTSGVATAPALHMVIYDAESGGTVQETLSEAVTANTRDGSFAISPTVDGWAQFEVTANATGAGSLTLDVEAPVWRVADDGQAAISAEPSRDDPSLVFLEEIQRINHRLAASESVWHAESERAFAGISGEALVRLEDDQALAAQQMVLESQISGVSDDLSLNYLSIAGAAVLYLTAAEIDSAMTLFDLSLNASHQAVVSDVADLGTNLATNYRTSSEADLVFMTSAQVNSVVTLFDLSLNASHQSVVTDLATLDGEVDALAADLTTNYYTSAEADLTFTTLAEVNAAISTYSVTIGATTLTLEEWVEDHNSELDPAVPGSTANVAVNALAQTDFGSEFDTRWNTAISTYAVSVNSASRTLVGHLDHIEDGVDGIASDLAANYYTQAEANAQFMTGTEVDSAIAAYQLTVNASTRTIFGHLDHIEDLADTTAADLAANYYTEAQADGLFMTSTEVDSAIGAIQFTVNASTRTIASHLNHIEDLADATAADLTANYYTRAEADLEFTTLAEVTSTISTLTLSVNGSTRTIAGHLDHVEDGMDAVTSDLAANYLTTAEANAEFMTATEVDSAIGSYQISVNAATRTIANHLNHIEDGMDAVTSDLAANYYTEAEANSQFMTASEVDSAIGSWTVSVNASTRSLSGHLNHIEDLADATALDLATNYYTEAEADLAFMTAAEVDSAIATYAITIGATTQDIEAWVDQHAAAITTIQGGGATYALELGVGDLILGVRGLNDGILRSFAFELDTFIIHDGASNVQPFFYDAVLGKLSLQNIAVKFADIEDLEVDRIHLASGVLPAKKIVAPIYDGLIWNGNNSGDPSTTAHFKTITRSVPKIAVKEGDTIAFEYQYHLSTQFNSFSWFTFKDRIEFTLWFDDGTWSAYIPQVPEIEHNYGAVNNTGGGPGGTSPVPYHSTRRHEVVASGSPFVQSGKTLVEVEAKLIISPDARTGGTQCVWASVSGWQTKVKTTLKYLEINASLSIFPTQ